MAQANAASLSPDLRTNALRLALAGKIIEAVKTIRDHSPLGLKECKDIVEHLLEESGQHRGLSPMVMAIDFLRPTLLPAGSDAERLSRYDYYLSAGYVFYENGEYRLTQKARDFVVRFESESTSISGSTYSNVHLFGTAVIAHSSRGRPTADRLESAISECGVEAIRLTFGRARPARWLGLGMTRTVPNYVLIVITIAEFQRPRLNVELNTLVRECEAQGVRPIGIVQDEAIAERAAEILFSINFSNDSHDDLNIETVLSLYSVPGSARTSPAVRNPTDSILARYEMKRIRSQLTSASLRIVCGAGVSVAAGCPTWPELLKRLYTAYWKDVSFGGYETQPDPEVLGALSQQIFEVDPIVAARRLRSALGERYEVALQESLYATATRSSSAVEAIAQLCADRRQFVDAIVTFNFDDLIETALRRLGVLCYSVFREGQKVPEGVLPIYHVHGFVPRLGPFPADAEVVFDETEYHKKYWTHTDWSTDIQRASAVGRSCLFIGTSFSDPNMRRVFGHATSAKGVQAVKDTYLFRDADDWRRVPPKHYMFRRRWHQERIVERIAAAGIEDANGRLAEILASFGDFCEEDDAAAFEVCTVWVSTFDEVPDLVRMLAVDQT